MDINWFRIRVSALLAAAMLIASTVMIVEGISIPLWYSGLTDALIASFIIEGAAKSVAYGKVYFKARRIARTEKVIRAVICPVCEGKGAVETNTCHGCGGNGWIAILNGGENHEDTSS